MATVVEALVTTFTLDASEYIKNAEKQRAALKAMTTEERQAAKDIENFGKAQGKAFKTAAKEAEDLAKRQTDAYKKASKEAEDYSKKQTDGFRSATQQVVAFLAVFTAGKGIVQFAREVGAADATLGRLATNLNISTNDLDAWGKAAEQFGGTSAGVNATFEGLNAQIQQLMLTGHADVAQWFNALNIHLRDSKNEVKPLTQLFMELSKAVVGMDRQKAVGMLSHFGLDPGMMNAILLGPEKLQAELDKRKKIGVTSPEDAAAATKLQQSLNDLKQGMTDLGRKILTDVSPAVVELLGYFNSLTEEHKQEIIKEIGEDFHAISDWVRSIKRSDIDGWATSLKDVVQACGGIVRVTEIMMALWVGSKFVAMIRGIALMRTALIAPAAAEAAAAAAAPAAAPGILGILAPYLAGPAGFVAGMWPKRAGPSESDMKRGIHDTTNYGRGWGDTPATPEARSDAHMPPNSDPRVEAIRPLLNLIGKAEGSDREGGYNSVIDDKKWTNNQRQNLTGMTLDQIDALQTSVLNKQHNTVGQKYFSSAIGRYQFMQGTLHEMRKKYNISGDTKFDEAFQDKLAYQRIMMTGGLNSRNLANIWASLPVPGTGSSAYQLGTTGHAQRTGVSQAEVDQALLLSRGGGDNSNTSNHHEVNVGQVVVHTAATDSKSIAQSIKPALAQYSFVTQANTGVA